MKTVDKARDLRRMKWAATGLLIAMIALFAAASWFEQAYPVLRAARAFAEAGIAGGLADWFAVTALFRHPLGLPLPHTAIIPRNKARIGENLGAFFERNFLSHDVVADKLAAVDLSGALIRWLGKPGQVSLIASHMAAMAPEFLAMAEEQTLVSQVRDALAQRIRRIDLAPIAERVLAEMAGSLDYDAILLPALDELAALFHENHDAIRGRVRAETAWIWQRVSLDEKVADAVIRVIDQALVEVRGAPDHPWRARLDELARERLARAAGSPRFLEKCEALREQWLESQAFSDGIVQLGRDLTARVRADTCSPDSLVRERLQAVVTRWAHDALQDEALRARLNERVRDAVLDAIPAQRHQFAQLISETVQRWDAATVAQKLELEAGRDLQFVRINGTLIGGLVGLVLYVLSSLA